MHPPQAHGNNAPPPKTSMPPPGRVSPDDGCRERTRPGFNGLFIDLKVTAKLRPMTVSQTLRSTDDVIEIRMAATDDKPGLYVHKEVVTGSESGLREAGLM